MFLSKTKININFDWQYPCRVFETKSEVSLIKLKLLKSNQLIDKDY